MAKNQHQKMSPQTHEEAVKVAKATQRPGQTKEQTKLIAQGIEKGITHYKKQQKERARALNKKLNKVTRQLESPECVTSEVTEVKIIYKHSAIPWGLLIISWAGFLFVLTSGRFL